MDNMLKCNICGKEFVPVIDKHYIARDDTITGVVTAFKQEERKIYDVFDCPNCGCQVIAQERKRNFITCDIDFANGDDEDEDEEIKDNEADEVDGIISTMKPKCFGEFDDENILECGCCKCGKECEENTRYNEEA